MRRFTQRPISFLLISLLISVIFTSSLDSLAVRAAYQSPVTWSDMSNLGLPPVFQSHYASQSNLYEPSFSTSAYELVIRDADNRINHKFKVPLILSSTVLFWLKIYTEYTTQHAVLFDAYHPELVYEVLDFRPLAKTSRNRVVYEILQKRKLEAILKAYQLAFSHLSKNSHPQKPTREQRLILATLKKIPYQHSFKHPFKQLAENLKVQLGQRDNVIKGLLAAETFFPKMEKILAQGGLSPELTRITLVESSFNLNATSRVGAKGVWQFMPNLGKRFLKIDKKHQIDERLSPLKSTAAAVKLLKQNYKIFKNWTLAITAYHHGMRKLLPLKKQRPEELATFSYLLPPCKNPSPLGWASRNYYAEFLAILHAEAYRGLFYGEPPISTIPLLEFKKVQSKKNALELATLYGLSLQEFRLLNPDIQNPKIELPKNFLIAVLGKTEDLSELMVELTTELKTSSTQSGPIKFTTPGELTKI